MLGSNLVFFDTHLPKENVSEIIKKVEGFGVVEDVRTEKSKEAWKMWKTIVEFRVKNITFRLVYYAEDATNIGLKWFPELENGIHAYFVKVPFPKEQKAGSLREPKFFSRVLRMINVGGFYLERECPISFQIPVEELGFEKVASGYISALSVHDAKGNLYRKVKKAENLEELVLLDWMMASDKFEPVEFEIGESPEDIT